MCNMDICTEMVNEVKSNAIHQTIRHHSFMNLLLRYKNKRLLVAKLPSSEMASSPGEGFTEYLRISD